MLKKVLVVLTAVLLLCSCAAETPAVNTNDFSCNIHLRLGSFEADGTIVRAAKGCCTIKLSRPSVVAGLTVSTADGKTTVSYGGMTFEVPEQYKSYLSAFTALVDALDASTDPQSLTVITENGQTVLSGSSDSGPFKLTVYEDGTPSSLTIDSIDMQADFTK